MKSKIEEFPIVESHGINVVKLYPIFLWIILSLASLINPQTVLGQSSLDDLVPKKIEVNSVSLHYIEQGGGTPVVFVHGSLGDYRTWHYQMEAFSKKYRAISYSRRYSYPNEGPPDSVKDFSKAYLTYINDLVAFIKALKAGPVQLVGHSAGAWITLVATMQHPELVRGLTLGEAPVMELVAGDTLGESLLTKDGQDVFMPATEAFRKGKDKKATNLFIGIAMGDEHFLKNMPTRDREIMYDNIAELKADDLSGDSTNSNPFFNCADIQKITVPALLVSREKTPRWLSYLTDKLASCIQDEERVTLANTSHGLEFQSPKAFNKTVLLFIDTHGG